MGDIMTKKQKKVLYRIIAAAALMLALHFIPARGLLKFGLYLIPYAVIGTDILIKAAKGIKNRQPTDECFLMAIATVGAMAVGLIKTGDYAEAVLVMLFYQIGELFQSVAVSRSRRNITKLLDIRPDHANIERDGALVKVDPFEVPVGSIIVIQPGEKIPIDGIVTKGLSALDTAALTGESLPRDVGEGVDVVSGCINMTGVLYVRTTKAFEESTVSRILDLVENAAAVKSRPERFVARFARVYTPAVCIGALLLALVPPVVRLALGENAMWADWIYRALTFLVISCPCALVISIPLTFFAGIGGAGNQGILVKGGNYLDALSKTKYVALDKTGTLTRGVFEVSAVYAERGISSDDLLLYAALAECASSHPIAKSLRNACKVELDRNRVSLITEHSGKGVTALVDGKIIASGNEKLMAELGVSSRQVDEAGAVVHIAVDGKYGGCIVVSDMIKPSAANAISALKKAGIKKTVMLTGDRAAAANAVSSALGIDEVHSGLLPEDKAERVKSLLEQKGKKERVAFVGDGINDAPVLALADVGIAMGALGSDAAIEAADVVLMDDDPEKIAKAIRIAKKTMSIVYQNILFSLLIKGACLLLGAAGIAGMPVAVFADVGVMVIAVLNALRALIVKKI